MYKCKPLRVKYKQGEIKLYYIDETNYNAEPFTNTTHMQFELNATVC
jgi:hypothetical protein